LYKFERFFLAISLAFSMIAASSSSSTLLMRSGAVRRVVCAVRPLRRVAGCHAAATARHASVSGRLCIIVY